MDRLKRIKLLAMDVDGVLTDGGMVYLEEGGQAKVFNVLDGLGIRMAMLAGLRIAWITGNVSPTVERRAQDLGVGDLYQGARHKPEAIRELAARYDLNADEIAYVGDDLNDLPAIAEVGVAFAVNNAATEVKQAAQFTTTKSGGAGAVREVIETILTSQGRWQDAVTSILEEFEREQTEGRITKAAG
ncbi:MAG: HAD hydrolase family protein [Armatimonadota bacterium]|nr:HAD hydrolase family protein [Armatimonadota bacterium]